MEGIEAYHRSCDTLDEAVVLLDDVMEVFDLQDLDQAARSDEFQDDVQTSQTCQIGTALVEDNPVRQPVRVTAQSRIGPPYGGLKLH